MPTTHDGHRRSHPIGLDVFALVLVAIVVGTVVSIIGGGWPGYVPALVTAAAVLLTWLVLSRRSRHRAHRH